MKFYISVILFLFTCPGGSAQQISYSKTEDYARKVRFSILGKVDRNYLVLKKQKKKHFVSVYDHSMHEIEKTHLSLFPDDVEILDFIPYQNYVWLFYKFTKKNNYYCYAVKIDSRGQIPEEPHLIDETSTSTTVGPDIYKIIYSEDKNLAMLLKISIDLSNNQMGLISLLYDPNLNLIHTSHVPTPYFHQKHVLGQARLSNNGQLIFTAKKIEKGKGRFSEIFLNTQSKFSDSLIQQKIDIGDHYIEEVTIKIDNLNSQLIANGFYFQKNKKSPDGLYTSIIKADDLSIVSSHFIEDINDPEKDSASDESDDNDLKNLTIRDMILKKDGSFLLTAERFTIKPKYTGWEKFEKMYLTPAADLAYKYYFPKSFAFFLYTNPTFFNDFYYSSKIFSFGNILIFNMDNKGNLSWVKNIEKNQRAPEKNSFLSYSSMITDRKIQFLFNRAYESDPLLDARSIDGNGHIERNNALFNLARGHLLAPKLGQQVSATEILIPWVERNKFGFAKIEF